MSKISLLLIDDEIDSWYMAYYIEALEKHGFAVTRCGDVDEARGYLEGERRFEAIGIDIIMPPGKWLAEEDTNMGLMTGKFVAENATDSQAEAVLFFLTNMADPERTSGLKAIVPVFQKLDTTPNELAMKVKALVEGRNSNE